MVDHDGAICRDPGWKQSQIESGLAPLSKAARFNASAFFFLLTRRSLFFARCL